MEQHFANLVLPVMNARAGGSTTGWRIRTSHFDEENEQCNASGSCEVYKNSQQSTDPFTIILTRKGISTADKISRKTEPLRSLSGGSFVPTRTGQFSIQRLVRFCLTPPCRELPKLSHSPSDELGAILTPNILSWKSEGISINFVDQ